MMIYVGRAPAARAELISQGFEDALMRRRRWRVEGSSMFGFVFEWVAVIDLSCLIRVKYFVLNLFLWIVVPLI